MKNSRPSLQLIQGDCLEKLKALKSNSIDSLVTDPPAGISFMGKEWDHHKGGRNDWVKWMSEVMSECMRVLKPGAHGLVWAIPRTSHWTATALEDAGFEIRDVVTHLFGSGFPKSLDVSKAIDKAAGAERAVVGKSGRHVSGKPNQRTAGLIGSKTFQESVGMGQFITAPATDSAKQWQGWGTALKPASEHWILVRKPCSEKTVAKNVEKWGCGAINIDASRVVANGERFGGGAKMSTSGSTVNKFGSYQRDGFKESTQGRFPANLVLSHSIHCTDLQCDIECAIQRLDEQSIAGGMHCAGKARPKQIHVGDFGVGSHGGRERMADHRLGDSGGASRFFYCAKISTSERNAGLEELPDSYMAGTNQAKAELKRGNINYVGEGETSSGFHQVRAVKNSHPTVKPKKLMSYFCTMITPPGGTVLDPFMGSGSTGIAAVEAGFGFTGIERDKEYFQIAKKRIAHGQAR